MRYCVASCIIIWDEGTHSIYSLGSGPPGRNTDKYAKFADSAYFANLLFFAARRCLPKLATWAAWAKVTLCLGKFIALKLFTMGPPCQKPHLLCGVSPCEEKSTARLQCKKELKINAKVRNRL